MHACMSTDCERAIVFPCMTALSVTQLARPPSTIHKIGNGVWFYYAQIKDKKVSMGFGVVFGVLSRSDMQSAVMHEKTIARSHSVLMHVCMADDFIQLSINRPTDIGAGCALLGGTEKPLACLSPDSDSSRDFGSEEVYPGRIWAILKKKNLKPKMCVLTVCCCFCFWTQTDTQTQ